jgi:hypothetical protein
MLELAESGLRATVPCVSPRVSVPTAVPGALPAICVSAMCTECGDVRLWEAERGPVESGCSRCGGRLKLAPRLAPKPVSIREVPVATRARARICADGDKKVMDFSSCYRDLDGFLLMPDCKRDLVLWRVPHSWGAYGEDRVVVLVHEPAGDPLVVHRDEHLVLAVLVLDLVQEPVPASTGGESLVGPRDVRTVRL